MTRRKDKLRTAALDHLLEHGVASASLRPMAAALGTSARILMFHFKSKEGLLHEALQELQRRLQVSFAAMVDTGPGRVAPLKRFWRWAASPENAPCLRLLYEAQIIAIQNPAKYGRYLEQSSAAWQAISLEAMSEPLRSGPMARLCIAVFDGLMLEYLSTGNLRGTTQALDHFIALASPPQDAAASSTRARSARTVRRSRSLSRRTESKVGNRGRPRKESPSP
ncbi:MAG TPA: TetR/AcrR family transcriptional regulator [Planctomycetota bacterium]